MTGPAFASALVKMELLKRAARDVAIQFSEIGTGGFDINKAGAYLVQLRSKIQSLGIADIADINVPQGKLITQLAILKRIIGQSGISDLIDFNINPEALSTQLHKISTMSETIPINFKMGTAPAIPDITSLSPTRGSGVVEKFSIQGLVAAKQQLAATTVQSRVLSDSFGKLETAKDSLAGDIENKLVPAVAKSGGNNRGGFGWWGGVLGGTIGAVGLWHVGLDLAVEGLIAVTGAVAAAAVGLVAMAPAATDIYQHLNNLHTIAGALNQNIPPMTGNFQALSDSLKPNVVEAYGGGLRILNSNTGVFGTTAHQVAGMLDNMVAKLVIWDQTQRGLGRMLQTGVGFLSQFGHIFGQIAMAVDNLIQKDPGIAHFLLDFLGGAASLLNIITKLPAPIVETALALHGMFVYGNVAAGLLGRMVGSFGSADSAAGRLGKTLSKGFSYGALIGPAGGLVAIGAAIAYVAIQSEEANTPTVKFANALQKAFLNAAPADALRVAGADIATYQKNIANAASPQSLEQILKYQSSVKGLGSGVKDYFVGVGSNINKVMNDIASSHYKSEISDLGHAITGFFSNQTNEAPAAAAAVRDYRAKIAQVVTDSANLRAVQLSLVSSGNSWTGALDIMSQAGVKAGDSEQLMITKIDNLIGGFQNLGIGAGQAAAMFNAVNYATGQADNALGEYDKSMQPAIAAEAQLFGVLTGGESTMYSFLAALGTMGTDAKVAGASLNGFNGASVKLGNDLYGSVLPAAESFINSIQMQGASMKLLVPIVATTASQTLSLTGQNKAAKLAMVDLINGALGPGTVSMKTLDGWVGKNSVSQQNFAKDVYTSMQNASGLAGVLNKNLIPMMNQAWIQATNLAPAMKTWFTDVINGTTGTARGQRDRAALVRDIINAGTAAGDTKTQIEHMIAQILNIPLKKAIQIYMQATGSGSVTFNEKIFGNAPVTGGLKFLAKGGKLPGYGGGDRLPALLEAGETVIDKNRTKDLAWLFSALGVPGFASGGLVPKIGNGINFMSNVEAGFGKSVESGFASAAIAKLKADVHAAANKVVPGGVYLGPGGSYSADITTVLRQFGMPLFLVANWLRQIQTESGGNLNAVNRTDSNALAGHPSVGLLQLIPSTFAAFSGPYRNTPPLVNYGGGVVSENAMAQIYTAIKYADIKYGGAQGMAAVIGHGHGYDNGGWLKPGWNMAYNGTGNWEHLSRDNGSSAIALEVAAGGASAFEQFMVMAIREWVVRKGGGNVQKAFGIHGR
jgi:hypothetical protein